MIERMGEYFRVGPVAIGATETTIATIPSLWSVVIESLRIYNQSASTVTVTGHTYDQGGSAGTGNEFLSQAIPTKETIVDGGWALSGGGVVSAIGSATGCTAWLVGRVVTERSASQ